MCGMPDVGDAGLRQSGCGDGDEALGQASVRNDERHEAERVRGNFVDIRWPSSSGRFGES